MSTMAKISGILLTGLWICSKVHAASTVTNKNAAVSLNDAAAAFDDSWIGDANGDDGDQSYADKDDWWKDPWAAFDDDDDDYDDEDTGNLEDDGEVKIPDVLEPDEESNNDFGLDPIDGIQDETTESQSVATEETVDEVNPEQETPEQGTPSDGTVLQEDPGKGDRKDQIKSKLKKIKTDILDSRKKTKNGAAVVSSTKKNRRYIKPRKETIRKGGSSSVGLLLPGLLNSLPTHLVKAMALFGVGKAVYFPIMKTIKDRLSEGRHGSSAAGTNFEKSQPQQQQQSQTPPPKNEDFDQDFDDEILDDETAAPADDDDDENENELLLSSADDDEEEDATNDMILPQQKQKTKPFVGWLSGVMSKRNSEKLPPARELMDRVKSLQDNASSAVKEREAMESEYEKASWQVSLVAVVVSF